MIKTILAAIPRIWDCAAKEVYAARERTEKAKIAKAFNDRYTYSTPYCHEGPEVDGLYMKQKANYAWMCPDCNRVHKVIGFSAFTGMLYPKCCSTPEGHRTYYDIAVRRVHL